MASSIVLVSKKRPFLLLATLCGLACSSSNSGTGPLDTGVSSGGDAPGTVEAGGPSPGNLDGSLDGIADTTNDDARLSAVDVQLATYKLNGVAQKGPFGNGTNITIAECDNSMAPTGRTFATSIVDNTGAFSLPNVQLSGKYVRMTADGFYFDEVANQLSVSRIALNALADVTNRTTVNVNLLTHLEQPRLEHLVGQGASFASAKAQAQTEVLGIFGFTLSTAATSESLDIARGTDDDAMLLAVSAILQGWREPGELTELLSNIATDIKTDGVLNGSDSGSALMNGAMMLNLATVRSNLEHRYSQMGVLATIGNFEKYVQAFIHAGKYAATDMIAYPATGTYGPNFLDPSMTTYPVGASANGISFRADLPRGASIKVALQGQGGAMWAYAMGRTSCWTMTTLDSATQTQEYSVASSASAQSCDLNFFLMPAGMSALPVDVGPARRCIQVNYYENFELTGATLPTATKQVCDETPVVTDAGVDAGSPVTLDGATEPQGRPDAGVTPDAAGARDDGASGFPLPTITSFVAAAGKVTVGQSTTLTPIYANGTGVLTPGNMNVPSGLNWPTGPISVPTTYTLTVTNPAGDFVIAQVTVDVTEFPMPTITNFDPGATMIEAGHATTLTAVFTNGTGVITPSVGAVTSGAAVSTGVLNTTTTYTLTVTNTGGDTVTKTSTVTVVPAPATVVSGLNNVSALAADGTNVYWTAGDSVMKVALAGGGPVALASGQTYPSALATDGANVYWTDYSAGTVMRVAVSGTGTPVLLASDQFYANAIAVDGTNVYWTTYSYGSPDGGVGSPIPGTGSVMEVAKSGGVSPVTLASGQYAPTSIAVVGTNVYWNGYSTDTGASLSKAATSGGSPVPLAVALGNVGPIVADAAGIYWIAGMGPTGGVQRLALSGGAAVTLVPVSTGPNAAIGIDTTHVYWVDPDFGKVMKAALTGDSPPVTLALGQGGGGIQHLLAVDATSVYWNTQVNGTGGMTSSILRTAK